MSSHTPPLFASLERIGDGFAMEHINDIAVDAIDDHAHLLKLRNAVKRGERGIRYDNSDVWGDPI